MSHVDEGTLHAYLDGELPSGERAAVDAHLAQCAACRGALAEERALLERASALLGSARPVERPAPPFEQIRPAAKRSPWRVRTSFAWAASVMLALGLGYYLRDPGSDMTAGYISPTTSIPLNADSVAPTAAPTRAPRQERQQRRADRNEDESHPVLTAPTDVVAGVEERTDSPAVGALALKSSTQLRNASPAPAAPAGAPAPKVMDTVSTLRLQEAVVSRAVEGDTRSLRGRTAGTTQWQIISRGTATTLLGTDPVGLPGLATRRIRRSPAPDATVVVEQALDSSTVIQIFQRAASAPLYYLDGARLDSALGYARRTEREPAAAPRDKAAADRLARFVGKLRVEIAGPLSSDSLNRLLEQVEPLPQP